MLRAILAALAVCAAMATPAGAQDPDPAMNQPDKVSWELFVLVSKPGGVPGKTDVVFETWASNDDTFAQNPVFPGASGPSTCVPAPVVVAAAPAAPPAASPKILKVPALLALGPRPPGPQVAVVPVGSEEVRRNRVTFDFIFCNKLHLRAGLRDAFAAGKQISFPIDSVEMKAIWRSADNIDRSTYYVNKASDGNDYALIAMHVISKQVPNWTWATFEHRNNAGRCDFMGCRDNFGAATALEPPKTPVGGPYPACQKSAALKKMFTDAGMPGLWENYCLKGSQADFTTPTGQPTLLGNSVIEDGFARTSSCLTCHSRASVSSDGSGAQGAGFLSSGQSPNGAPNPSWFWNNPGQPNQSMRTFQTDFIWSIPREAK